MSFRVVRNSKFRHVFGAPLKREQCYDNIRVSKSTWDSTFCAVNPKFLAIIIEAAGGGAFMVIPLHKVGRIERDFPLVTGHRGPVLDVAWCPFNDCVIASGSEDCVVRVWQVPDVGLHRSMADPVVELSAHQRRVVQVLWHPTANNVLLSAGGDNRIIIWNVGTSEILVDIECHPDVIYNCSFNYDGSRILSCCKDKKLRVMDSRTGEILQEATGHEGAKPMRAIFLKNGSIFTTGFSRMSERQYALRDGNNLAEPLAQVELDTSNGVMFPLYDEDTNLVYLCGKGDSVIRYFEVTDEHPYVHYINTLQSPEPQRGIGMMPKRGCDVNLCEIARFYRLQAKGYCEVIAMTVPRKSELFQDDLYPDTASDTPALSADEWFSGVNADPILVSLKGGLTSTKKADLKITKKSNVLDKMPNKAAAAANASKPDSRLNDVLEEMKELKMVFMDDIKRLKITILKHENRIRELERQVASIRVPSSSEDTVVSTETPAMETDGSALDHHSPSDTNIPKCHSTTNNDSDSASSTPEDTHLDPDEV